MYKSTSDGQISLFPEFILPFGGHLDPENRWVKYAAIVPWDKIDEYYCKSLCDNNGRNAISSRMAFSACFVKQYFGISDEEVPATIAENPYIQYFAGYTGFVAEKPFDSSMMVHFRKRFPVEFLSKVNECINTGKWPEDERCVDYNDELKQDEASGQSSEKREEHKDPNDDDHKPGGSTSNTSGESKPVNEHPENNKGKLIVDATVIPADIAFPTDVRLLDECREKLEYAILILWSLLPIHVGHMLPYVSKKAHQVYLDMSKSKKWTAAKLEDCIGKQLVYVEKALDRLDELKKLVPNAEAVFPSWLNDRLAIIPLVYEQQKYMFENGVHSVEHRIVSLQQYFVRPIMRGKRPNPTEFGQKLHLSVVDGFTYLERTSWENFNESLDLKTTVEDFYRKFGCYPAAVLADKIYQTRENRKFCKALGIRLSGPALGRKNAEQAEEEKRQMYQDACERNAVEGRNGNLKRRYGLDRVMSKLDETAKSEMCFSLIVMNSVHKLRKQLFALIFKLAGTMPWSCLFHCEPFFQLAIF